MALELDTRQRAMLLEMGVRVWLPLPESGVVTLQRNAGATAVAASKAAQAAVPAGRGAAPVSAAASSAAASSAAATAAPANRAAPPAQPPASAYPERRAVSPKPAAKPAPASVLAPVDLSHIATLDWPTLAQAVRTCQACTLCRTRSHASIAPLTDALPCDWMLVSDPPDEEEDRTGHPFAGADGQLLNNMLRALGLHRANANTATATRSAAQTRPPTQPPPPPQPHNPAQRAYVSHALKCRPPHGINAEAGQLAQCAAYLQREIALVQPKMILSMGRFANQLLLSESPTLATQPLAKQRGTLHHYQGIPLVVTYSPKQLMRNQSDKAKAWADLCFAADVLVTKY